MPRRHGGLSLDLAQLSGARLAYEQGAFQALAVQHAVSEITMRRLLRSIGVEPRPRGVPTRQLPVELILADHDSGMSARAIAQKHGLGAHHQITTLLRAHGLAPHHRGRSKGNRGEVPRPRGHRSAVSPPTVARRSGSRSGRRSR